MSNHELIEIIRNKIKEKHHKDEKQLEVIFSTDNRLLVEAPAGYGKTNTMVSKIAYMLATNQIPNPKKLLALTFSVNAAYKIKKDITNDIPELLENFDKKININDKIFVSNYHGFCRSILKNMVIESIKIYQIWILCNPLMIAIYSDLCRMLKDYH